MQSARSPAQLIASAALVVAVLLAVATRAAASDSGEIALLLALAAGVTLVAAFDPGPLATAVRHPLALLLTVACALGTLSVVWTIAPARTTLLAAAIPAIYLLTFLLAWTAGTLNNAVRAAAILLSVLVVLLCAGGLIALSGHTRPWSTSAYGNWRPTGPFEYSPALAVLAASAVPCALRELLASVRQRAVLLFAGWAGAVVILASTLVLTQSRLALVLVGLWLVWAGLSRLVRGRQLLPGRVLAAALAVVVVLGIVGAIAFGGSTVNRASHDRVDGWRVALRTTAREQVQGGGLGSYRLSVREHLRPQYQWRFAHSLPLDWSVELGWIGLILGAALLFAVAWIAYCGALLQGAAATLAPFAAGFAVANLFDWSWYLPLAGLFAFIAAGVLAAQIASKRANCVDFDSPIAENS